MCSATTTSRAITRSSTRRIPTNPSSAARRSPRSVRAANISFRLKNDHVDFQVSSYVLSYPRWATTPDTGTGRAGPNPFVAGQFVWTGFDYLGEPTPYNNDSTNLLNFSDPAEKARMEEEMKALGKLPGALAQFVLRRGRSGRFPEGPVLLSPSGLAARLSDGAPAAALELARARRVRSRRCSCSPRATKRSYSSTANRWAAKRRSRSQSRLRWDEVTYEPGELKVVAYKGGRPWAENVVKTTGDAKR